MQRKALRYDKAGDQHYDYISAWIKSIARVGPGRVAVLPGGDARGRRGRALHRAPDGRPGVRGRRQRGPAGAAGRGRRARTPSSTSACRSARSRSRRRRSTSSLAPKSNAAGKALGARPGARSASTARRSRPPRCAPPRTRRRGSSAAASATTTRTTTPGTINDQEHLPEGREHLRFYDPGDDEPELRERLTRDPGCRAAAIDLEAARAARTRCGRCCRSRARARYIRRAAVAMLDELDDLAPRLADETGWPRAQLMVSGAAAGGARAAALADDGPRALADTRLTPRALLLAGRSHADRAVAGRPRRPARAVRLAVGGAGAGDRRRAAGRQRRGRSAAVVPRLRASSCAPASPASC